MSVSSTPAGDEGFEADHSRSDPSASVPVAPALTPPLTDWTLRPFEATSRPPWLVVIVLWSTAFVFSRTLRRALYGIATSTPGHYFALIQTLRIGAIGGIVKGLRGEVTSDFVFWIGGPDFVFGLSAVGVAWLLSRKQVDPRALIAWNLVGFSLIVFPTFLFTNYWMNEPGYRFIFEFPMVLAPSIVVPIFISLNLLHAWGVWRPAAQTEASAA